MADPGASCAFYRDKIVRNEGRKYADVLAGQGRPLLPPGTKLDVVFVAFGFHHQPRPATTRETEGPNKSQIAELGVACLNTRRLNHPACSRTTVSHGPLIETWGYKGLPDDELTATITQHLRIRDAHSPDPGALRTVVLVSTSMPRDFNILDRIGTDFASIGHITTTMDIPALWAQILPSAPWRPTPPPSPATAGSSRTRRRRTAWTSAAAAPPRRPPTRPTPYSAWPSAWPRIVPSPCTPGQWRKLRCWPACGRRWRRGRGWSTTETAREVANAARDGG